MTPKIDRRAFLIASAAATAVTAVTPGSVYAKIARVRVTGLKVAQVDRPLGLENPKPRLSWRLESPDRGVRQSAYRILVASRAALLQEGQGDVWDSGKV